MPHESDWKLFRAKLPLWQENYMNKLTKEYVALLQSEETASSKFWALADRIKDDRKCSGVQLSVSRSEMRAEEVATNMRETARCILTISENEIQLIDEELAKLYPEDMVKGYMQRIDAMKQQVAKM